MPIPSRLTIDRVPVRAYGRLDLLETRLVHITGSLDPTPHAALVAERAAHAIVEHSDSCALLHDGPGVAAAAADALMLAEAPRVVMIARRGVTSWHETLAARGGLVLDGPLRPLMEHLADATLVVEQAHASRPDSPHVACVPGPILTPATAGSNALLLRSDIEIVAELDHWARRLRYAPQRERRYGGSE